MRSSARAATRQAASTTPETASQAQAPRATIANVGSSSWVTDSSYLPIAVKTTINTSFGQGTEFLYGNRANVRLGFGCARLMRLPSRRHRQALLGEAFEQGIRHFDVARMYGLGAAEGELGRFARGRREEIGIATKFGIDPGGAAGRLAALQAPARAIVGRFPALRSRLKRRESSFHTPRRYDAANARASLETSLRELGTDYVDVLFIHDPEAVSLPQMEELVEALEDLREAGKIRAWGVSGRPEPSLALAAGQPLCVPQLEHDVFERAPTQAGAVAPVHFGVLASALERIHARLAADSELAERWRREVGADPADPEALADLLLQDSLDCNPAGGTIFATGKPQRIGRAVAAAAGLSGRTPAALSSFRRLLEQTEWGGRDA
jgi:D-threo-aldose 1-dehydrogenase